MSHTHSHDGLTDHSHSHDGFSAAEHGHSHEILDGPGSYLGREMPIVEGRDWNERAFTIGIGGYELYFSSVVTFCPVPCPRSYPPPPISTPPYYLFTPFDYKGEYTSHLVEP